MRNVVNRLWPAHILLLPRRNATTMRPEGQRSSLRCPRHPRGNIDRSFAAFGEEVMFIAREQAAYRATTFRLTDVEREKLWRVFGSVDRDLVQLRRQCWVSLRSRTARMWCRNHLCRLLAGQFAVGCDASAIEGSPISPIASWTSESPLVARVSGPRCRVQVSLVLPPEEIGPYRHQCVGQRAHQRKENQPGGGIEPTRSGQRCAARHLDLAQASPEGLDAALLWTMFGWGDCGGIARPAGDGEESPVLARKRLRPLLSREMVEEL